MATKMADYGAVSDLRDTVSTSDVTFGGRCEKYFAELNRWYVLPFPAYTFSGFFGLPQSTPSNRQ